MSLHDKLSHLSEIFNINYSTVSNDFFRIYDQLRYGWHGGNLMDHIIDMLRNKYAKGNTIIETAEVEFIE